MKSLFDDKEMYTEDAISLERLTKDALDHIFMHFIDQGYSAREIKLVMYDAIEWVELRVRTLKRGAFRSFRSTYTSKQEYKKED